MLNAAWLIEHFGLEVLPVEETRFVRTYTSEAQLADGRAAGSAIIGLISREPLSQSLFHRVACDEMWHFYLGEPFRLVVLHPDGSDEEVVLGPDLSAGQVVQFVVPAGSWQSAELLDGSEWALFGCTVTPEFTPESFEGASAASLLATHPQRADEIERLAAS